MGGKLHGLCQVEMKYKSIEKTYCVDIAPGDPHSPIAADELSTKSNAIRRMGSAAIREVIEQFLVDLKTLK